MSLPRTGLSDTRLHEEPRKRLIGDRCLDRGGFRVQGSGFMVFGFRVQGLGFRV
jgi:hypothetical protein